MSTEGARNLQEHPSAAAPAVEFAGVTRRFGAVLANDHLSFRVQRGTIHGIVGENGAGKSTAMKLLYGMYPLDAGEIFVNGIARTWHSPAEAIGAGIGMVHQHFMLAGPYTALDNILLGAEPTACGLINRGAAKARLAELAAKYGLSVDWDQPVEELPLGLQQRVEILKLLFRNAEILILDEPTAVLTPQESARLFANLLELRKEGKTILLVTHKLKEVLSFTDAVTVLRHGTVTGEVPTAGTNAQELARLMVGRTVGVGIQFAPAQARTASALEVAGLTLSERKSGGQGLAGVSFCVRAGEIVGVAGVEGNGQGELVEAVLHPADSHCRTSGRVSIAGQDVTQWPAARVRDLGVALVPEDRLRSGLLLESSLQENLLLGFQRSPEFSRFGLLRKRHLEQGTVCGLQEHDVRPPDPTLKAGHLSGGNQQKLIFAREFQRAPKLVVAAQPTRGVDVGATEAIHRLIVQARDRGAGVLLVSSDLDEILALSDRILVMYEGRLVAEYGRGQASERDLGLKMGGA